MGSRVITGVYFRDIECFIDERGSLQRLFDYSYLGTEAEEFKLSYTLLSRNPARGTLRGLHYQEDPHAERKFMSCLSGSVFIVMLDLRSESDTFLVSASMTLSAADLKAIHVPAGLALGWMTLETNTDVHYSISGAFNASASCGVRFDDPILEVTWPSEPSVVSEKDLKWPPFRITESGHQ